MILKDTFNKKSDDIGINSIDIIKNNTQSIAGDHRAMNDHL